MKIEYTHKRFKDNADKFDQWFDAEKFDRDDSIYLAIYCHEEFKTWWDPDKFNWHYSYYLAIYCHEEFKTCLLYTSDAADE